MRKNGFTLIELLAVIVILAIIALIATPIVLNIIEDSKKSAFEQTGNGIVDAAEYYYMKEMSDGTKPTKNKVFTFNGSTSGIEGLEFDGEIPKEGTLTVDVNGNIELAVHNNKYCLMKAYTDNEISIKEYDGNCGVSSSSICTLVNDADSDGKITAGDKYQCKVKNNMEENWQEGYNFYVLTTPVEGDTTINLIMDQNINSDGTPAGMTGIAKSEENAYNLTAWNSNGSNTGGPITAMKFLYNATKDWTNIEPVNYTYNDKEVQGTTEFDTSYTSFVSVNGVSTMTPLSGEAVTIGSETTPLRARMIMYASDATQTEVTDKSNASYLYDNLDESGMNAPYGYWTLSSCASISVGAWHVDAGGSVSYYRSDVGVVNYYGVRPVITVLESNLS